MIENFDYLLRHLEDKMRECERKDVLSSTAFLDMAQKAAVLSAVRSYPVRSVFYGGYADAERTVCIFLPDYIEDGLQYFSDVPEENPLEILRCRVKPGSAALSHRDYLGALMGLGIKRETIGDIIVKSDGADIIIKKEMEEYLYASLSSVGRMTVETEIREIKELRMPEVRITEERGTVPSLRLDAMIAEAFHLSRDKACQAIAGGLVFVDDAEVAKPDAKVKEGAKLVLRGSGKCVFKEMLGATKKDRVAVLLQRYN